MSRLAMMAALLLAAAAPLRAQQPTLTHRRHALLSDVGDLLSIVSPIESLEIPEADRERLGTDGLAELKKDYKDARAKVSGLAAELARPMTEERLTECEQSFPQLKSSMLSLLFSATSSHYFDDQSRFLADKESELAIRRKLKADAAAQGRGRPAVTKKERARINAYARQLGSLPDAQSLARLYDAVGAAPAASAEARLGRGPDASQQSSLVAGTEVSEFRPSVSLKPAGAPPPPTAQSSWDGGVLAYLDQTRAAELARYARDNAVGFTGYCLKWVYKALTHVGVMTAQVYDRIMPERRSQKGGTTQWAADVAPAVNEYLNSHDGPSSQMRLRRIPVPELKPWLDKGALPIGAVIVYSQGTCGFNRQAGHIEVVTSQDPLMATSDGVEPVRLACVRANVGTGRVNIYVPAKVGSGS